ncbi:BRCA2-interacting transcriptional repressor EMSY [Lingula anatina]|uniref:BRCA2-interacting transcriptional repressor EMSY n=2 Tax=Lingula anatina TaxID=7574 RepID=A0A1S3I4P7_LINAN|nr:BRCA2-interacting transcriptional repressor EMSY [Lingula anatina]|eukprot:XP_013393240.1 BRCA2-interacting transcriptional repressor EMSY [Lingula anatina]
MTFWPQLLDLSRDECKRILRRLELEAYSNLVSAFRAQGDLTKDKKKLLLDLQQSLSISTERHRAEVRRAVNDEKLTTIADCMSGPNVSSEWLVEGRRLVPLMPRLVPQTAFTLAANHAAQVQAEKNAMMPLPSVTGNKDLNKAPSTPVPPGVTVAKISQVAPPDSPQVVPASGPVTPTPVASVKQRPSSPASNVVVLPSGMSIHIKGGINTEEEDEFPSRKRKRSNSVEGFLPRTVTTVSLPTPKVTYTTTSSSSNTIHGISPMKITISKSPQKMQNTVTPSQKVILVSSSGQSSTPNILQKSITVPIIKTTATTATSAIGSYPKTIVSPASSSTMGSIASVVSSQGSHPSGLSITRPRPKTIQTRPKVQQVGSHKPGIVIPMSPQQQPSPQSVPVQLKSMAKPTIQIKQEGGMKIITHSVPSAGSKILPKPQFATGASGNQVVVVTSGAQSSLAVVTKASVGVAGSHSVPSKVLNITTQGGKVIAASTSRGGSGSPNVVTVNPKTLQLTSVRAGTSNFSTVQKTVSQVPGKPNVIVVQKGTARGSSTPSTPPIQIKVPNQGATAAASPFEKEFGTFLNKQDVQRQTSWPQKVSIRVQDTRASETRQDTTKAELVRSDSEPSGRSSILAELIQAVGIGPDSGSGSNSGRATPVGEEGFQAVSQQKGMEPLNQWVEYDEGQSQQMEDASAIKALLEMKNGSQSRSSSLDIGQIQLQTVDLYALEQALSQQAAQNAQQEPAAQTSGLEYLQAAALDVEKQQRSGDVSYVRPHTGPAQTRETYQGELDPRTGLFYSSSKDQSQPSSQTASNIKPDKPQTTVEEQKTLDIFSSALAQAEINLDPYQFVDEEEEDVTGLTPSKMQPVSSSQLSEGSGSQVSASTLMSILSSSTGEQYSLLQGSQTTELSQDYSQTSQSSSADVSLGELSPQQQDQLQQPQTLLQVKDGSDIGRQAEFIPLQQVQGKPGATTIHVLQTVQQTPVSAVGAGDTLGVEELTGQLYEMVEEEAGEGSYFGSSSGSDLYDASSAAVRASKRKRKAPLAPDDSPPHTVGGWTRVALGLLQRVSRFRGANREKGEVNAASWFTRPVDEAEAPGYHDVIKNPMDFSTIRRKLEVGMYANFSELNDDMLLVRDNCYSYNPPGHDARRDCDEVFAFYQMEYEKTVEKWNKSQQLSPSNKKIKLDKSPSRS